MTGAESEGPASFAAETVAVLSEQGWIVVRLPAGLTLVGLRAGGAPFKSEHYFDRHALTTAERTTFATDLAYKPALLPGSFNRPFAAVLEMMADLAEHVPAGTTATLAPAAAYVWLLERHHSETGGYPFSQLYAWAVDEYQARARLVVGVFGQQRPLVVAPLVEGHGSGVGVWPLLVPSGVAPARWPLAHTAV